MTGRMEITVGFLPLLDSAILIAATEKGFAADEGLSVSLVRETSWANVRDRLAVGHFEAAHLLAPMPIASNLGLTPLQVRLVAPLAMGLGGNAVTVSNALFDAMSAAGPIDAGDAAGACAGLKAVIAARAASGQPPLRFAVVHPFSGHNYELRYWLASCGVLPDRDVEIVIVPPPLMADALGTGAIDGYCVGEPWNSVAVRSRLGHILTVKAAIWRASPEKVLGMEAGWAERNPQAVEALVRAMVRASLWCGESGNHAELADILSRETYLNLDTGLLLPALTGRIPLGAGEIATVPDFYIPSAQNATFPWASHALWFYSQMVRWGHATRSSTDAETALSCYRPDIYRQAVAGLGLDVPDVDMKMEGGPAGTVAGVGGFFDGQVFDPSALDDYIDRQQANDRRL